MRTEEEVRARLIELTAEARRAEDDGDVAYMEHRDWEASGIRWVLNDKDGQPDTKGR